MIVHQVFAMIYQEEVKNVFICDNYELANYIARATYDDTAFAVDCLQYTCSIGCKYVDGIFYQEDGTILNPLPTQEQQVTELNHAMEQSTEYNLELDYRTSKMELGI